MESSMGNVICCSISDGLRLGATVLICTCIGVVSGNASTGIRNIVLTPYPKHIMKNNMIYILFFSENSIILFICQ